MINIYNMHNHKPSEPYDIKVDRSSILGSPYYLKSEKDRNNVCNLYHEWFYKNVTAPNNERITFKKELQRLIDIYLQHNKLNLFCWCAPKRCHAETIKQYILNEVANKEIIGDESKQIKISKEIKEAAIKTLEEITNIMDSMDNEELSKILNEDFN